MMENRMVGWSLLSALLLFTASARADSVLVGSAIADKLGNGGFDLQVDSNADPQYVSEQLRSSLQLSNGASIDQPIVVENGSAHVAFQGATPGATVDVTLPNDVIDSTGVSAEPRIEKQRRGAYLAFGGAVAGLVCAFGGCSGGGGGPPPAPLSQEPPPLPVLPTPAPPVSPSI